MVLGYINGLFYKIIMGETVMQKIIPARLQQGDEIRVIAPASGIKIIGRECREIARRRFEEMGLVVTYGTNATDENWDAAGSTAVEKRCRDIADAFADPKVKAVFTMIGGNNSNQLLDFIDYNLIAANPKIFCGFSDITALLNAIYAKTGLVTFSGPHFSSFGMLKGFDYTLANMQKMLFGGSNDNVCPSDEWSDDLWFLDQQNRQFIANEGWWHLQPGKAEGTLIGGNLGTFNLLNGTSYRPAFGADTVLFIEDTGEVGIADFTRNFQSLLQQPDAKNIKAILIGRFQKKSEVTRAQLEFMIERFRPYLEGKAVIANLDFGHSTPLLTLPVGGTAALDGSKITFSV